MSLRHSILLKNILQIALVILVSSSTESFQVFGQLKNIFKGPGQGLLSTTLAAVIIIVREKRKQKKTPHYCLTIISSITTKATVIRMTVEPVIGAAVITPRSTIITTVWTTMVTTVIIRAPCHKTACIVDFAND
uniref:Uncharacterized protein n=1 Tax=Glossina pallidipes TaxID=7398 RepID=A0A1B0A9H7_GLOPL